MNAHSELTGLEMTDLVKNALPVILFKKLAHWVDDPYTIILNSDLWRHLVETFAIVSLCTLANMINPAVMLVSLYC